LETFFENPLSECREKNYSPSLRSLSKCWRMRDSSACFFFFFFFFWEKSYFVAFFVTYFFTAVKRTNDETHVKLLKSLVAEISDVFAKVNVNRLFFKCEINDTRHLHAA